jgi:hypothetical protein
VYSLRTVNGSTLPVTVFQSGTYSLRITAGSITINSGTTFSSSVSYTETEAGQTSNTTSVCTGTYTVNGNSVFFSEAFSNNDDCGGDYTGSWNGSNDLTVAFDASLQAVFRR